MDIWNEAYILLSAIFISVWFALRVPKWMKKAYEKSVARNGYSNNNVIQYIYEVFFAEGAI